jgi:hypothetical protein
LPRDVEAEVIARRGRLGPTRGLPSANPITEEGQESMSDKWIFDQIGRGNEETYYKKKEQEVLEKLRSAVERERERRDLGEELNIYDERVLEALSDLGFTREVLVLLHVVPLVEVAWSDGAMSPTERAKILELAALRGIVAGTPAYERLLPMLENRPPPEAFNACARVIRVMLSSWPEDQRRQIEENLPAYAAAVARASGGVLGIGAVSRQEQAVLDRIAREIADAHAEAAKGVASSTKPR